MKLALLALLWATFQARAFDILTFAEEIPESNPVTRTRLTHLKTQLTFIAPPQWVAASDPAALRLTLQSANPRATITIQLSTNAMPADAAELKARLLPRFEAATVLEEFQAPSAGVPGLGLDIQHVISAKFNITTRLCLFPAPDGAVEITLAANSEDFPQLHPAWTWLLNSFRLEPRSEPPKQP
jgi:hypothetical protein